MIKVLIDQGHGAGIAHKRGALCFNEGDNNFHYSTVLKVELEKYEGVKVDLVRKKITDNPSLAQRSAMGKGYDLFLSKHSNAHNGQVRGSEVWDSVERPNKALAQAIVDATASCFNHNNRGVKYKPGQPGFNYYGVLRFNEAKSSMIIESGFHDNALDCNFFKNNHQRLAEVQAKAIANHYKLKKKGSVSVNKPVNNTPSSWAKESWEFAKQQGWLDGTRPKSAITREEVAEVLFRLHKSGKLK